MKYNKTTLFSTFIIFIELVARLIRYNKFFFALLLFFIEFSIEFLADVIFSATKFSNNLKTIQTTHILHVQNFL